MEPYSPANAQKERILLAIVRPCIRNIESIGVLKTFHFLFEPNGLHLRIRAKRLTELEQIRGVVENHLCNFPDVTFSESSYTGEENFFGVEGWKYVQKFFEFCSRISLLNIDTRKQLRENPTYRDEILLNCNIPTLDNPNG